MDTKVQSYRSPPWCPWCPSWWFSDEQDAVRSSPTRQSIVLKVRPELLLGDLERLGRAGGQLDLHRIVFAEGIAFPILGHQQPSRIGMPVEHDAEKVPDLALEPTCRR